MGMACSWAEAVWATLHVIQTLGYEVAFMFAAAQWISSWHWQCQDVANNGNHCVSFCCCLLLLAAATADTVVFVVVKTMASL